MEQPKIALLKDVRTAEMAVKADAKETSGFDLYDSAYRYFSAEFFEAVKTKISYRNMHSIAKLTHEDTAEIAEYYDQLFTRTVIARQILEPKYESLFEQLLSPDYNDEYTAADTLAHILSVEPTFASMYAGESERGDWQHECGSTVYWMQQWMRAEVTQG